MYCLALHATDLLVILSSRPPMWTFPAVWEYEDHDDGFVSGPLFKASSSKGAQADSEATESDNDKDGDVPAPQRGRHFL